MDIHSDRCQMGIWGSVVYRVGDGGFGGVGGGGEVVMFLSSQ